MTNSNSGSNRKLLMHQCCGPCATYPVMDLQEKGYEVSGYFYNPNIHPLKEFYDRMEGAYELSRHRGTKFYYNETYGLDTWMKMINLTEEERCKICYSCRVHEAASFASKNGYGLFTSSLLYSKHQNHQQILELCNLAAAKHNVEFVYEDFRDGWKQGIDQSKDYGLYRQQYCGCIYSERDRYEEQLPKKFAKKIKDQDDVLDGRELRKKQKTTVAT